MAMTRKGNSKGKFIDEIILTKEDNSNTLSLPNSMPYKIIIITLMLLLISPWLFIALKNYNTSVLI